MRCVVSCGGTSFPCLVFFGALPWWSMVHKHTGRWMWQGSASVVSWNWEKYSCHSELHRNLRQVKANTVSQYCGGIDPYSKRDIVKQKLPSSRSFPRDVFHTYDTLISKHMTVLRQKGPWLNNSQKGIICDTLHVLNGLQYIEALETLHTPPPSPSATRTNSWRTGNQGNNQPKFKKKTSAEKNHVKCIAALRSLNISPNQPVTGEKKQEHWKIT